MSMRTLDEDADKPRRALSYEALRAAEHIKVTQQARAADRARRRISGEKQTVGWRSKSDKIIGPIFYEAATRRKARCMAAAFVTCAVLGHIIGFVKFRLFTQQSKAIESMDVDKFYVMFPRWLCWHLVGMACQAITQYSIWELRMMVQWRTAFYLINALYTSNTFYYLSLSKDQTTRTPEQLMCEEAFMFVEAMVNLSQNYLREIPDLLIKMYLLFEYRTFFLVYALMSLPVLGTIMAYSGKTTTPLTTNMLKTHADINFVLARIQNNAEQIALFKGGSSELRRWEEMLNTYRGCLLRQELLIPVIGLMSGAVVTVIMAPLAYSLYNDILDGSIAVAEALNYFRMVSGIQAKVGVLGITMGLSLFQEVRAWTMCNLIESSERFQERDEIRRQYAEEGKPSGEFILIHERAENPGEDEPELELRDVAVTIPVHLTSKPSRTLLSSVSLKLHKGESLLIVGGTGVGKSALLLSIQGLWYSGRGQVHRCCNKSMFCVPQRPYMFRASLRDNMMYPEIWRRDTVPDSKLHEVLKAVNLEPALRHYSLDEVQPWNTILSLGQQQRLAIARGLLMKDVRLLLLDEATSALDMKNEQRVYTMLRENVPCYVSVGHRPSVREYHTHVVMLEFNEELLGPETTHNFMPISEGAWQPSLEDEDAKMVEGLGILEKKEQPKQEVPAFWSVTAGGGVGQQNELVPSIEDREREGAKTKGPTKIVGPNMNRHMGGIPLVVRAARDVVLPLCKERHFYLPVSTALGMLVFCTSVLGVWMASLMGPVMAFQDILRLRNRDLAWQSLLSIAWQVPCIGVLGYFSTVGTLLLTTTLFVEAKRGLARLYLDGKTDTYYHLHMSRLVQNPGTRISNWDTQAAIRWLAELVSTCTMSFGLLGVMWRLSAQTHGKIFIGYLYIGWFVLFVLFHSLFKNYNGWLSEIMNLHANVIHTRENAEAVALLDGSESERVRAYEKIDGGITPGSKYVWQRTFFGFVSSLWYTDILDLCLMCVYNPMVLMGIVQLGESETSKNLFRYASSFAANISRDCLGKVEGQLGMERLWELMVSMTAIRSATSEDLHQNWGGDIVLVDGTQSGVVLELKKLTLKTPLQVKSASRTLIKEVDLTLQLGETLLIAGESGIGKSSLVRAIAGLWRNGDGEIHRPPWRHSFFIAQRPYMCIGTLREQLLYPRIERRDIDDERLENILRMVDLDHLLQNPGLGPLVEILDSQERTKEEPDYTGKNILHRTCLKAARRVTEELPDRTTISNLRRAIKSFTRYEPDQQKDMNWCNSLSLGEIQRISFARLLLQEDLHLVMLDEATSGLSPEGEEAMYKLIKAHTISYVSVAHRPQLRRFHQRAMVFEAAKRDGQEEQGPATYRDLPMIEYEVELAEQEHKAYGSQPDE